MANPVKQKAVVEEIIKHGMGTYELRLKPEGRIPRFKAGQFLHLSVDEYDPAGGFWPESRVFSISSRSGAEKSTIVYSVKGRYTKRMEEQLAPGREVWLKLPFGNFTIESRVKEGSDIVLVAGGTGISPYVPYLEDLAEGTASGRSVRLYYGIRSPEQLLFSDILTQCQKQGAADIHIRLESKTETLSGLADLEALKGRLDPETILKECTDLSAPDFFLSGPPAMIKNFKASLLTNGVDQNRIQIDEWE